MSVSPFGFEDKEEAERVFKELQKYKTGVVKKIERETKKEEPPPLHSLTSLQREANKIFGFSAKRTLEIAQKLYEDYKVISYPRTESRYLAEANRPLVVQILKELEREDLIPQVGKVGKRVFNDEKLTDHHAIIPLKKPLSLPPQEKKIYDLILKRFLAVFYPPYVYEKLRLFTEVGKKYLFYSEFKKVLSLGWKILYKPEEEKGEFPPLQEGDRVKKLSQKMEKRQTQPPPRFTEGTLLKEMERLGLGTPATRATIIETLKERGYLTKKGKVLVPTQKGRELIQKLSSSKVASPSLTAEWEKKLEEINLKKLGYKGYKNFLESIKDFTAREIEELKGLTFEVKENSQPQKRVYRKRTKKRYKKGKSNGRS